MTDEATSPLVKRAIERSVSERVSAAADEIELLLAAAFQVIERSGNLDPPIREILREAGLSTPAFYRHFRSKDELMVLVHDRGVRILVNYLHRRMARVAGPFEKVAAYIDGVLRQATPRAAGGARPFGLASRQLMAAFPEARHEHDKLLVAPLAEVIADGQQAGVFRSSDPWADASIIRDYAVAALHRHLVDETPPNTEETARLIDFARRALAAD